MNPTVSKGQAARAAKSRARPSSEPLTPRNYRKPGPPLPPRWREDFLAAYAKDGVRWIAATRAGVSHDTVSAYEQREPDFAAAIEHARQEFADSREMNLARLANEGNVVGDIVLLKKHRPAEFVEKNISISASFTSTLDPAAGHALLATMLGHLQPNPAPVLTNPIEAPQSQVHLDYVALDQDAQNQGKNA